MRNKKAKNPNGGGGEGGRVVTSHKNAKNKKIEQNRSDENQPVQGKIKRTKK